MAKYYVECSERQMVILGTDAQDAARRAIARWCNESYEVLLGTGVKVNERGFGHSDGERFATFDLIAELKGVTPEALLEATLNGKRL